GRRFICDGKQSGLFGLLVRAGVFRRRRIALFFRFRGLIRRWLFALRRIDGRRLSAGRGLGRCFTRGRLAGRLFGGLLFRGRVAGRLFLGGFVSGRRLRREFRQLQFELIRQRRPLQTTHWRQFAARRRGSRSGLLRRLDVLLLVSLFDVRVRDRRDARLVI